MDEEATMSSRGLKIKVTTSSSTSSSINDDNKNPDMKNSTDQEEVPSPYNSPSLISPPSSAFVSALQSPYISPRAHLSPPPDNPRPSSPPLVSSDDIPSSSYTPPSDPYEFAAAATDAWGGPPRISFSSPPVPPRISFAKCSTPSAATNNVKLRSCDVYVGFHGQNGNLVRFCKWLKSELELQGIACFVADRAKYGDSQSHEIADRVICSVTYGVVVVTRSSFFNHSSVEEMRFFSQKKNLIPIFFENVGPGEIVLDKEGREAMDGVSRCQEAKLEASGGNWRGCIARAAAILRSKLSVAESEVELGSCLEELPFPRNWFFVGREKELAEMEAAFFGGECCCSLQGGKGGGGGSGQSEGLADEESDVGPTKLGGGSKFISLELGKCKENGNGIGGGKRSSKYKKCKSGNYKNLGNITSSSNSNTSVICINGIPGIGKTELALEFAYRYSQRYKMVLWIGGEARYLRQDILNLSMNLGLDVSADPEKDRGRIRSFEEQELEAFKRVKRELFRDMPYLLIVDNLESEREWWEGKDLHDLIPRNTGGTHVIITTRLSKVMNFEAMQLPPLPAADAMVLIRGRRRKDYPAEETEFLKKFDEKLGRLSFGLWLVGSLLSELGITPSALFESINRVQIDEVSPCSFITIDEEQYCEKNPFLMKVLSFCFAVLQQETSSGRRANRLAARMLLVGAWFAPSPITATLLGAAADNMSAAAGSQFRKWTRLCLSAASFITCCSGCLAAQKWKSEEDSTLLLIKLGLARRANNKQAAATGCWIQFHPITQVFAKRGQSLQAAKGTVEGIRKIGNPVVNSDHLWASAFLVFGFKSEPPLVQLKAIDMVLYIRRTALPLAIRAFATFSRCNSALELLKVCTNVLEEVEKSFVSQIQDWCHGSLCWKKNRVKGGGGQRVDEYVWQDVTLLKATLLETRAKLLLRGGHFDSGEELCRTCISIRTVMLGHNHAQTLAAQETLAKLVRMRSKI
ncbi:uncharacterized protein LOC112090794 [Morus notabilis]|uniref:uncharacterized protein LOC112090794 n=1 Tax=Morus notabilis TaxID=981085 RepID=UPI000CED1C96|nr:uncharacterized protein LOC112090794 [Morus notabilis]